MTEREKLEEAIEIAQNQGFTSKVVEMMMGVADGNDAKMAQDAMRMLSNFYPTYSGANPKNSMEMLLKYASKNPASTLELAKIRLGNPSSDYIKRFGMSEYFNLEKGMELIDKTVELADKVESNFDYLHYITISHAYGDAKSRIDKGLDGNEKTGGEKWLRMVKKSYKYSQKAYDWLREHEYLDPSLPLVKAQVEAYLQSCEDLLISHRNLEISDVQMRAQARQLMK